MEKIILGILDFEPGKKSIGFTSGVSWWNIRGCGYLDRNSREELNTIFFEVTCFKSKYT